tara:strand:- start:651 stop:836 length:186 start_codon:yes stop_codon:yes gene_type:complete
MEEFEGFLYFICFVVLPLAWKPSRKAIGLLNIIVGAIVSLTGIGIIIGIPLMFFGGILLFM